ncbi:MAG: TetR/AcrR family transcriptional regulator [Actinobacteria bacterium]|nr:TetR/AcrR family transcriptional regulator [Actinomycetota bacterium]
MENKGKKKDKRVPAAVRRKIILDAASRTFVEFGYQGTRMETIAERADVTKPILYRHFPSKLSLLIAVVDQAGEELMRAMSEPFPERMGWRAAIVKDIRAYLDFVENFRQGFILLFFVGMSLDQEVARHVASIRAELVRIVAEHIRLFTNTALISGEDIEMYAVVLVGMVEAASVYWITHEDITRNSCEQILVRAVQAVMSNLPPAPWAIKR